jgi:hypothetical protein
MGSRPVEEDEVRSNNGLRSGNQHVNYAKEILFHQNLHPAVAS